MSIDTSSSAAEAAGRRFYFPESRCVEGHISVHRVHDNQCLDCLSDAAVKSKMNNITRALERDLVYLPAIKVPVGPWPHEEKAELAIINRT